MKQALTLLAPLLFVPLAAICGAAESSRPVAKPTASVPAQTNSADLGKAQGRGYNVLFIAVDDLNDWVGCLGGNPQAITPNLDRLAARHAMVMNKAYAPFRMADEHTPSLTRHPSPEGIPSAKSLGLSPLLRGVPAGRGVSVALVFPTSCDQPVNYSSWGSATDLNPRIQ